MARNYIAIPYDYLEEMADLNDAEFGRLVRAVLIYGSTGETVALCGNERFLYRRAIMQEQRFQSSYDELSARNGKNGKKGGRPKKNAKTEENPEQPNETKENRKKPTETEDNPEKPSETQITDTKTETETKTDTLPSTEGESISADALEARFSGELLAVVRDWFAYKKERRDGYKPTGRKALLTKIEKQAQRYGERAVIDVIRLSMENNWKGIIWDYLEPDRGGSVRSRNSGAMDDLQALHQMFSEEDT